MTTFDGGILFEEDHDDVGGGWRYADDDGLSNDFYEMNNHGELVACHGKKNNYDKVSVLYNLSNVDGNVDLEIINHCVLKNHLERMKDFDFLIGIGGMNNYG